MMATKPTPRRRATAKKAKAATPEKATTAAKKTTAKATKAKAAEPKVETPKLVPKNTAANAENGGWRVKSVMHTGTANLRHYEVYVDGKNLCGVAPRSVLVKHKHPRSAEFIASITELGKHSDTKTPIEGVRFMGVTLQDLCEAFKFEVPEGTPTFAQRVKANATPAEAPEAAPDPKAEKATAAKTKKAAAAMV